jgi:hypothetical protein
VMKVLGVYCKVDVENKYCNDFFKVDTLLTLYCFQQ